MANSSGSTTKHIIFIPVILVSHYRQMIGLATNLIREHPDLIITILTHTSILDPVNAQINAANFLKNAVSRRLLVVGYTKREGTLPGPGGVFQMCGFQGEDLPHAYQTIVNGGYLVSENAERTVYDFSAIPPPSLVVGDTFIRDFGRTVKTITPHMKVLVFFSTTIGAFTRHFAPSELEGMGAWEEETKAAMKEDPAFAGLTFEEAAHKVRSTFTGKVVTSHDGVEFYDHEYNPQEQFPAPVGFILNANEQVLRYSDGAVLPTTRRFEPGATETTIKWYGRNPERPIFFVGPQFRPGQYVLEPGPFVRPPIDHPVFDFLDRHPPKSVWLVSFGTLHYPTKSSQAHALLKVLLATGTPFIHSGMSKSFSPTLIPTELRKQISDSGLGLMVDGFVPQREVLTHPSIGAFVSHAGVSSLFESILCGVVGIFWPFAADQPYHAAYVSCGVRTGSGAVPPKRGGGFIGTEEALEDEIKQVIEDLKGETGARKRRNLDLVRRETFEALAEGGAAAEDARKLVAFE